MRKIFIVIGAAMLWAVCACSTKSERKEGVAETEAVVEEVAEAEPVDPFWRDTLYLDSISTDTLMPSHRWAFSISDGTFPSDTNWFAVLKGIETDGKGSFWFLGDSPARIACFEGPELKWSRNTGVNLDESYHSLFKIIGDSIWFVDEKGKSIYRMSKGGKGPVDSFKWDNGEYLREGYFDGSQLYVQTVDTIERSENFRDDFRYYRINLPDRVETITADEFWNRLGYLPDRRSDPPCGLFYYGKGMTSGTKVYENISEAFGAGRPFSIGLMFANGQFVKDVVLKERNWYYCVTGYAMGEMLSHNSNILRNGKLYTGGEQGSSSSYPRVFYLLEYDIDAYVKELLRRSDEKQKLVK